MAKGLFNMSSSVTVNSDSEKGGAFGNEQGDYDIRGHIESEGKFDVDDIWRFHHMLRLLGRMQKNLSPTLKPHNSTLGQTLKRT